MERPGGAHDLSTRESSPPEVAGPGNKEESARAGDTGESPGARGGGVGADRDSKPRGGGGETSADARPSLPRFDFHDFPRKTNQARPARRFPYDRVRVVNAVP